jgi:hypothetical protein
MATQLSDVNCWVKTIEDSSGKNLDDGAEVLPPAKVIVRYSVANDSHKIAGPLTVVGTLFRNGVRVKPGGQPNVVPAQQITVPPGTVWLKEFTVTESESPTLYQASILGDVGGFVNEEDEKNNKATRKFNVFKPPA